MDPRLEANRTNWNERVGVHTRSRFYDVDGWLHNAPGPNAHERAALGDLEGKSLVHLQCHFGMDTMRMARAGALVTGVDFSPVAIAEARDLAERAGLAERTTFVCANVYDAPQVLAGARFDVVYVTLGSLWWLPNVDGWGEVVTALLKPGGRLFLHDVHPFPTCFDDDGERIVLGYFEESDRPYVDDGAYTYTDGEALSTTRTYGWNHALGEIVAALVGRGMILESITEHDWTVFQQFPWLEENASGHFVIPDDRPRIPLSFTLLARSPAPGSP